jgi:RNA polymerase sigma factor (sigma-70 family)
VATQAAQAPRVIPEAIAKLIASKGMAVVAKLAAELAGANDVGLDQRELLSIGQARLNEVGPWWDKTTGTRFTTYIYPFIKGAMKDEIRQRGRVQRTHHAIMREVERAQREFSATQSDEFDILHNTAQESQSQLDGNLSGLAGRLVGTAVAKAEELLHQGTEEERVEALHHEGLAKTIREAVSQMKPALQRLWQQHYREGVKLEDYAKAEGVCLATAKNYHKRFRDKLEVILEAKGYGRGR